MDYLVLWGGKHKGREKLYQTGDAAHHEFILKRLKTGMRVNWVVDDETPEDGKDRTLVKEEGE